MIKQLKYPDEWPKTLTDTTAVLNTSPEAATARWGITFTDGYSGLDDCQAAIIEMPNGKVFALVRHHHDPSPGMDIFTPWRPNFCEPDPFLAGLDVVETDVLEVLTFLGLTRPDLIWLKSDALLGKDDKKC